MTGGRWSGRRISDNRDCILITKRRIRPKTLTTSFPSPQRSLRSSRPPTPTREDDVAARVPPSRRRSTSSRSLQWRACPCGMKLRPRDQGCTGVTSHPAALKNLRCRRSARRLGTCFDAAARFGRVCFTLHHQASIMRMGRWMGETKSGPLGRMFPGYLAEGASVKARMNPGFPVWLLPFPQLVRQAWCCAADGRQPCTG